MRNNTNYMETGVLSALELTASIPEDRSRNFYKKSRNSIDSGTKDAPYGYVFPASQKDMTRVAFIVNILRMQGIEVGEATGEFKLGEGTYPAGSLVRQAQPALRTPGQDPARKAELPRPCADHLRRHRLDHGPDVARQGRRDRR